MPETHSFILGQHCHWLAEPLSALYLIYFIKKISLNSHFSRTSLSNFSSCISTYFGSKSKITLKTAEVTTLVRKHIELWLAVKDAAVRCSEMTLANRKKRREELEKMKKKKKNNKQRIITDTHQAQCNCTEEEKLVKIRVMLQQVSRRGRQGRRRK